MNLAMIEIETQCASRGSFPRFNPDTLADLWAESTIEDAGYATNVDRILARYENVARLFPTADELRERGIDIVKLAACLQEGLIVRECLNDTINSVSPEDLNGALEHLLEHSEAYQAHPDDAIDRSMHHQGCCSCRCVS